MWLNFFVTWILGKMDNFSSYKNDVTSVHYLLCCDSLLLFFMGTAFIFKLSFKNWKFIITIRKQPYKIKEMVVIARILYVSEFNQGIEGVHAWAL